MRSHSVDEITVFAILRPEVTELSDADRTAIRAGLLAEAVSPPSRAAGLGRAPHRPRPRRLLLAAVGATAAAAVSAAVLLLPGTGTTPPTVPPASAGPGHSGSAPTPRPPLAAPTTASAVLLLAARAAAAAPDLKPRPGQFIYVKQLIVGEVYANITKHSTRMIHVPPSQQRTWLSADGRQGLLRTVRYLPDGHWATDYHQAVLCPPRQAARHLCLPGYVTGLPTTVPAMRRLLLRTEGPNGPVAYRVLRGISDTSWEGGMLIPNRSYALMFRTAAKVPGIRLVHGVVDVAGRPGIAVAACVPEDINKGSMPGFHGCPARDELIFDARTYELIGEYQVAAKGRPLLLGSPSSALLQIAVVSRPGQLP
jgi:hypothetical protein